MDSSTTSRLDRIILMLTEFSGGNFNVREEVSDDENPLNTVIAGLNMLGEELDNYQKQVLYQRSFQQNVLSNIDEVIYVRTVQHDGPQFSPYTFITDRSDEVLGICPETLRKDSASWYGLLHPEDTAEFLETYKKLLVGKPVVLTYRIYHKLKTSYRWIEDRISPEMDSKGNTIRLYGSARDVTDQQLTSLQLHKTSQLVNRLITSSDQVFYILEIDQDNQFKNTFTYLSAHVEGIIGYSVEDVQNDPLIWFNAIHPEDFEGVKNKTREMFRHKTPGTRVYRMKNKLTRKYVWIEDYVVPISSEDGRVREFYASARDISRSKESELDREKLIIELGRKNEELMQFNHIVSHNLRSPVASILGLADLMQADMAKNELNQTKKYLLQSARAMDQVLQDLNVVLSVRSSLNSKMTRCSITEILNTVSINLIKEIRDSRATVTISIQQGADHFTSIKSYIQSIFFNLISNAIKYRDPSRDPLININVEQMDGRLMIKVQDNGAGIDLAQHREQIFMLYSRVGLNKEGKGLGLYMTKSQVEALNGSIEVCSELGKGTTFNIIL